MGGKLGKDALRGYEELTEWVVISAGEGHQPQESKEEAIASAMMQAEDTPNLVLAVYRLEHFVSARVKVSKPKLFDPPRAALSTEAPDPSATETER